MKAYLSFNCKRKESYAFIFLDTAFRRRYISIRERRSVGVATQKPGRGRVRSGKGFQMHYNFEFISKDKVSAVAKLALVEAPEFIKAQIEKSSLDLPDSEDAIAVSSLGSDLGQDAASVSLSFSVNVKRVSFA